MTVIANRPVLVHNPRLVTTPSAPGTAIIGVTPTIIVLNNSARTGLVIVNLAATNVYLAFGYDAVAQSGLTLLPSIGWRMSDFDFNVEYVSAIADQAGSAVSIQEFSIN